MFRLIPREEKYFELFNEMAGRIAVAAGTLDGLFGDIANADAHAARMHDLEHECDELTHEVLKRLNKSFITPIDREDIYALISSLDTVVDQMEAGAARVVMYHIRESTAALREQTGIIVETVAAVGKAVAALPSSQSVIESVVAIHDLESQGDAVYRRTMSELFAGTPDAITLIKYKEVYEKLEAAINACEDAANVLETIAVKNA